MYSYDGYLYIKSKVIFIKTNFFSNTKMYIFILKYLTNESINI